MPTSTSLNISLHGDTLKVENGNYSIYIPTNANGMRLLVSLLQAKLFNPNGKLGTNAKPTQQMVDEFLKNQKLEKENKRQKDLEEIASIF